MTYDEYRASFKQNQPQPQPQPQPPAGDGRMVPHSGGAAMQVGDKFTDSANPPTPFFDTGSIGANGGRVAPSLQNQPQRKTSQPLQENVINQIQFKQPGPVDQFGFPVQKSFSGQAIVNQNYKNKISNMSKRLVSHGLYSPKELNAMNDAEVEQAYRAFSY